MQSMLPSITQPCHVLEVVKSLTCVSALSPIPPFPKNTYRIRLAGLVAPIFVVSLFVTSYMFMKGVTFGVGFGFFGDPIISRGLDWLNRTYPNWQKLLEIRK